MSTSERTEARVRTHVCACAWNESTQMRIHTPFVQPALTVLMSPSTLNESIWSSRGEGNSCALLRFPGLVVFVSECVCCAACTPDADNPTHTLRPSAHLIIGAMCPMTRCVHTGDNVSSSRMGVRWRSTSGVMVVRGEVVPSERMAPQSHTAGMVYSANDEGRRHLIPESRLNFRSGPGPFLSSKST